MPANQPNEPRSVPGPVSMPRIRSTVTTQATSAATSTGVSTAVVWRATRDRLVVCTRSQYLLPDRRTAHGYPTTVRSYHVTTFGCQMNAHDSERIKGMLEELGLGEAPSADEADVVVFNTCTIREKPDTKLAAYLGEAAARKREDPDRVIAVGGCYAEAQRERIFELYPAVDVAFGPGSIAHLGEWLGAGGMGVARGRFGLDDRDVRRRAAAAQRALVPGVGAGLDGLQLEMLVLHRPRRARPRAEPPARRDPRRGARGSPTGRQGADAARPERQLVGPRPAPDIDTEFGELLRACDAVDGIERIRFTSPHPKDFREPVIAAMAECAAVCEHVHLPLQSGSSRILKAMRRTYTRERYLALVEKMRAAIPDLAFGTDIIVGFPGETEDDFRETLEVVEEVGYDSAFTFVYSPRAGTEAAAMPDQVPHEVKIERMERLVELTQRIARERNAARVGRVEEVLVEGPSRTDPTRAARPHAPQHDGQLHRGRRGRASSSTCSIEGATSTTLRGAAAGSRRGLTVHHIDPSGLARCASSSPARPARSARTSPSACCATGTRSSASTSGRTPGSATRSRRSYRISPATTRRSRAASTASSIPRSISSSTSRRTRRCTSSCASRTVRSRTRS